MNKYIITVAFIIYLTSAILNSGYYYYDEHYQIIEFAELKSGHNEASDLAWEYDAKIRPALQPAIAYLFLSSMRSIGVIDQYTLMIVLRIITALLSMAVIWCFLKNTRHLIDPYFVRAYEILALFLWFLPFVNVRFSSETYSGLAFTLAIACFYSKNKNKYLITGCLMGLSFLFRYQTAIMALGAILWLLFYYKINIQNLLKVIAGCLIALIVGFFIDYWFYEAPALPFINYYVSNIVDDVASGYGILPWYFYFTEGSRLLTMPIAIIVWACLIINIFYYYKTFLCWVILPFLIVHMFIPHKEIRFLFPLVNFVPLLVIMGLQKLNEYFSVNKNIFIKYIGLATFIIINCIALAVTICSPGDQEGKMNITKTLHDCYKGKQVTLWVVGRQNPYRPIPVAQNFYVDENIYQRPLEYPKQIKFDKLFQNMIVIRSNKIDQNKTLLNYKLKKIATSIPEWVIRTKMFFGYQDNSLSLFEVEL